MNFSAVEHYAFDNYCYPLDDNRLVINIKTGFDIERLFLIYGDPFKGGLNGSVWKWAGRRVEITEKKELEHHLWWTIRVEPELKRCKYHFELHEAGSSNIRYYLEDGFYTPDEFTRLKGTITYFIFPWMNKADIIRVPEWVKNTVWYQIFPDRFCNGDASINPPDVCAWAAPDTAVRNEQRYGGDLRGIIHKLDYLSDLGINGLYITPVNISPSVHKYDTADYMNIDPAFGSAKTMRELCDAAHKKGIRVILDGVFNHSGWDFKPWQDVVQRGMNSEYRDWFIVHEWPFDTAAENKEENAATVSEKTVSEKTVSQKTVSKKTFPAGTNAEKRKYMTFAYVDSMPKLNTNNPDVCDYLLDVCEKWVRDYDIDGLRLDVANEISHEFCRRLQKRMRALKSDFYITGEIWHNALPWLRGDEFDSVMNYQLTHAVCGFWLNPDRSVKRFEHDINRCYTLYAEQTASVLFNLLDSHDTARLITKNSGDRYKTWQQYALLFTLSGSPCIYYGTEVLLEGEEDPDCRRCMPWDKIEAGDYDEELHIIKTLISLRRKNRAMSGSRYRFITDSQTYAENRVVHLQKTDDDGVQTVDLLLNCGTLTVLINDCTLPEKAENVFSLLCEDNRLLPGGFAFFKAE
ncbi:glycoside hydrolase family 13 protein [Treponema sp.]|uniref:glycoside hydrolase family 13 protein n=1 Tax=Treponema sp. TaxID=166 RepID=UPI003FA23D97